jgi:capsular polysaccharide biosynthesis protein
MGYVAPGRSALLHWRLVASLVVIGLVGGVAFGVARPPAYTATATTYVGKTLSLNNTAAIAGLADAATTIASDYSRLIGTSSVTDGAAKRLGHPGRLGGTLAASVVPESPEILITATASSERSAVDLANAGSAALIAAVTQVNSTSSSVLSGLLSSYQQLELSINQDQQSEASLQARINSLQSSDPGSGSLTSLRSQLATLETTVSADTLKANAVDNQYQSEYAPLQQESQVISALTPGVSLGSDRAKALELGVAVGFFVGLLLGVVLASAIDLARSRHNGLPA